jgi:hypothetical protein
MHKRVLLLIVHPYQSLINTQRCLVASWSVSFSILCDVEMEIYVQISGQSTSVFVRDTLTSRTPRPSAYAIARRPELSNVTCHLLV